MDSLLIKGGVPLHGEVAISGAKNAMLPIMAATLLTNEPCVIHRVPNLTDVRFMGQILTWLGADVRFNNGSVRVQARKNLKYGLIFDTIEYLAYERKLGDRIFLLIGKPLKPFSCIGRFDVLC